MEGVCDVIECLSGSPQRVEILDALDGTHTDLRDLMTELDSPRTTLQRNLSVLEGHGWVKKTPSGYTTTTTGCLLLEKIAAMNGTAETIQRMAPFLDEIDMPSEVDVRQLNNPAVTTPESHQPHLPRQRLFTLFREADSVRVLLPVVSHTSVEFSCRVNDDSAPEYECVISSDAFDELRQQYGSDGADGAEVDPPDHIDIRVCNSDLPYGLFVSDDTLALAAHNEVGRMQAVVESASEESINWGEHVYESYRHKSTQLPTTESGT